ncbi:MAG TPA: thiamine pyrophosphate-dependent enzyme [Stellaceae bacterium]|nr:thiamine pyrophosphate-dependent enzyme [Stellaceae bacterium]
MKKLDLPNEPQGMERPLPSEGTGTWGSDCIAEVLRALDIPFVALNPGSSYRGLHDSIVNKLGNERPQMLLCLHEEAVVAIAHGWAKVTERPMLAVVHANVGLMHATMAIYNAWCDRAPLVLLGANGPVDAALRRPWIDWIHTTRDNGAIVRNYTKWDDQPHSIAAAYESILRARKIAATTPRGPTYVVLDVELQEQKLANPPAVPDAKRFLPPAPIAPPADLAEEAARRLLAAERPLILMGRVSRSEAAWAERVKLAETLGAVVLTDLKLASAFPTDHPLLGAPAGAYSSAPGQEIIRQADVVLVLDWVDPAGTLKAAWKGADVASNIICVSLDQHLHQGWSMDYQGLPPVDLPIMADTDPTVAVMNAALAKLGARKKPAWPGRKPVAGPSIKMGDAAGPIAVPMLAQAMQKAVAGRQITLIRHPLSFAGHLWPIKHPLDFLGSDGGGGVGSGPGTSVGAALALRGSGRLPVAILGDGDFMMGSSAFWTAVHYRVPLLVVVANNRSFYNDELHQERMARERGRPVENKWIGQQMKDPEMDLAMIARGLGATGFGPVTRLGDLAATLESAVKAAADGQVVVVDVRVEPGYDAASAAAITRAPGAA